MFGLKLNTNCASESWDKSNAVVRGPTGRSAESREMGSRPWVPAQTVSCFPNTLSCSLRATVPSILKLLILLLFNVLLLPLECKHHNGTIGPNPVPGTQLILNIYLLKWINEWDRRPRLCLTNSWDLGRVTSPLASIFSSKKWRFGWDDLLGPSSTYTQ